MKPMDDEHFAILRRHMVEVIAIHADLLSEELGRGTLDGRVLAAMLRVPRHLFVPAPLAFLAYQDTVLPIGFDKTISQPREVVLEIGTGLGYQTAVLAELANRVWSVEIIEEFAAEAELRLGQLGYSAIDIRVGDGSRGWAEHAPYDKILVAAAAERPPQALIEQLKPGGRLVLPVGPTDAQRLTVIDKDLAGDTSIQEVLPVRFSKLETNL
jgi:protein-L-isoaspartate(D-aspartate) O-methyltransferase